MKGKALRFGLGRSGRERKLKAKIAQHGLEAHVTDALLCALQCKTALSKPGA
jgi:hypothetical protein